MKEVDRTDSHLPRGTQKQGGYGRLGVGVVGTLSSSSDLCSWRCLGKSVSIGTLKLGVQIREVLAGGGAC